MPINVLSLFDGKAGGRHALDRLGVDIGRYFASEINPYPIKIAQKNYPDIIQIGDIKDVTMHLSNLINYEGRLWQGSIDLLLGGSPCQDLSRAKPGRKGLEGEKSSLFFEFVRLLEETKPTYFLFENVASMSQSSQDKITQALGVHPIMINAGLVSAQDRKRLYWTNIPGVVQPEDRGIHLSSIMEDIPPDSPLWKDVPYVFIYPDGLHIPEGTKKRYTVIEDGNCVDLQRLKSPTRRGRKMDTKIKTLVATMWKGNISWYVRCFNGVWKWRPLTCIECERLQGLTDDYTAGVSMSRRREMIGNGWQIDAIVWILSFIPKEFFISR